MLQKSEFSTSEVTFKAISRSRSLFGMADHDSAWPRRCVPSCWRERRSPRSKATACEVAQPTDREPLRGSAHCAHHESAMCANRYPALANTKQPHFSSGACLFWNQTDPSRERSPRFTCPCIAHRCDRSGCGEHAHALYFSQGLRRLICLHPRVQPLLNSGNLLI